MRLTIFSLLLLLVTTVCCYPLQARTWGYDKGDIEETALDTIKKLKQEVVDYLTLFPLDPTDPTHPSTILDDIRRDMPDVLPNYNSGQNPEYLIFDVLLKNPNKYASLISKYKADGWYANKFSPGDHMRKVTIGNNPSVTVHANGYYKGVSVVEQYNKNTGAFARYRVAGFEVLDDIDGYIEGVDEIANRLGDPSVSTSLLGRIKTLMVTHESVGNGLEMGINGGEKGGGISGTIIKSLSMRRAVTVI